MTLTVDVEFDRVLDSRGGNVRVLGTAGHLLAHVLGGDCQ